MKQLLFYNRAVPVSSERHREWSVRTDGRYEFAKAVNSVPIVAAEFRAAAVDCAIVFTGEGEQTMPAAILGLRDGENLYVAADGAWSGRYVPAFVRRYPFVFSTQDDGKTFTLCLDEEFEGVNQTGEGEKLFDSRGERTQYLENVLTFVREYQAQFQRTQQFAAKVSKLGLLEPMQAQFRLAGGQQGSLTGFMAVNREKVKELSPEDLARMARTDELELLYVHLQSLANLTPLLERVNKSADETKMTEPAAPEHPAGDDATAA